MNRTFILGCISLIQRNKNQFMTDEEFNELCELHQIHENYAIQQLFAIDLFVRVDNGFFLKSIND